MVNLWYILMTRHFSEGDKKELYMGEWPGAFECNSKEHALEIISIVKKRPYQLAQSEQSEPTYEPIPYSALDAIFPNRNAS